MRLQFRDDFVSSRLLSGFRAVAVMENQIVVPDICSSSEHPQSTMFLPTCKTRHGLMLTTRTDLC